MQSFLCRLLVLVFTFNCIAPTPGAWAQSAPRKAGEPMVPPTRATAAKLTDRLNEQIAQQMEDSLTAAVEAFQTAESTQDLANAIVQLHEAMDARHAQEQKIKRLQEEQQRQEERERNRYVAQRSSTYVAPRLNPNMRIAQKHPQNEVLARLAKDDLLITDMIDYIDPFDPAQNSLQNTVYASEILGNSIDAFLQQPDEATIAELNGILPMAQLRVLYRLNKLSKNGTSSVDNIMAVGSLRIALWKLHTYFTRTNQKDPLLEPKKSSSAAAPATMTRNNWMKDGPMSFSIQNPAFARQQAAFTLPEDIYNKINNQFISELNALKAKDPKEGDEEYQYLLAVADYATVYAMLANPLRVKNIVQLFDGGVKRSLRGAPRPTKFQQQYSPVLNAIFTAVFESTKYSPRHSGDWNGTIEMLKDFSDPEQYSIPTRVFALEAASLLFRPFNSETLKTQKKQPFPTFFTVNSGNTDESTRRLFANRTADIYCPLTYTHYLAIEDYGLDSKQMQMLADKLAYIYDGFYDISSTQIHMPGQDPHQYSTKCAMVMKNQPNAKKVDDENGVKFVTFVGNAIFWIYGGEIFALVGTAFRVTKGAMVALPSAVKAASAANKGRRALSFGVEIQKGVRYARTMEKLNKAGVTVLAETTGTRLVTRPVSSQAAANGTKLLPGATGGKAGKVAMETVEETFTQTKAIRSMRGLRNQNLTNLTFSQPLPGFSAQLGTVNPAAREMLKGGIKNYNQWRKVSHSLIGADGQAFRLANLTSAEINALRTEAQLMLATRQAAQNGVFDLWLPLAPKGAPINAAGQWHNISKFGVPQDMTLAVSAEGMTGAISESISMGAHRVGKGVYANLPTNPMEFSTTLGLPGMQSMQDWVPSLTKHLMETKQFSVLGEYALKNTRFWSGFNQNLKFFGAWAGLDMMTYPYMQNWVIKTATEDQTAEMKKYGDAFDPKKLAQDQDAQKEQELEIIAAGGAVNNNAMSAYNDIAAARDNSSEGALIVFPILAGRHSLSNHGIGKFSFVSDQDKATFEVMAARIQMNRALREQGKVRKMQWAEMEKQAQAQLRDAFKEQIDADRAMYEEYFLSVSGTAAKNRITALFKDYEAKIMAVLDSSASPDAQYEKITQAQQDIEKALKKEIDDVNRMNELLMQEQQKAVSEEEYIPYEGAY